MIARYTVPMRQMQFEQSVSDMAQVCSKFKLDVFRNTLANSTIDSYKVREFLGTVNAFLRTWETYAMDLQGQIKSANPGEKDAYYKVIEYQEIKPFIYASYDYASILQFADGIVRGAKNADIRKNSQYEDFFKQAARRAFKDRPADAGMMVSEVTNFDHIEWSQHESDLFKSNKHKNFFDNNDRMEIYKSIEKTVEFLVEDILSADSDIYSYFDGVMRSSACNWIIEYVKLTLTAYASRIYAISSYASDYINISNANITPVKESVDNNKTNTDQLAPFGYLEYTFMRDLDESIVHNPINYIEYVEKVKEWAKTFSHTASAPALDNYVGSSIPDPMRECILNNIVYNKLTANSLYDYFEDLNYDLRGRNYQALSDYFSDYAYHCEIEKLVRHIKDFISSQNLGVGLAVSPVQDMVEIIKNVQPTNAKGEKSETLEAYEQLALNIILAHFVFAGNIFRIIKDIIRYKSEENKWPNERFRDMACVNEIHKMLIDIYKTVGVAVLFRCRDIEMKINDLRRDNMNKVFDDLSIKIPGTLKDDYSKDDNNAMAVPDTNRSMNETADLISIASEMDQLVLYDEWVKSLPGMENDWYYSEAGGFQGFVDAILALLNTIKKKWDDFFNNATFKAAVSWCNNNKETMLSSNYNGSMSIMPYVNLTSEHLDKIVTAINNCNPNQISDQNALANYEKQLYPGKFYGWFHNGDEHKDGTKILSNAMLYGVENENAPAAITVSGDQLKDRIKFWLACLSMSTDIYNDCKKTGQDFDSAIKSLQSKVVALKPAENTNTGNNETENTEAQKKQAQYDMAQTVLTRTKQAITDLYVPVIPAVTGMLRTEYKYIQQAWGLRVQPGQQAQPTQTQQPTQQPAQ